MSETRCFVTIEQYRAARQALGNSGGLMDAFVAVYADAMADLIEGKIDGFVVDGVRVLRAAQTRDTK